MSRVRGAGAPRAPAAVKLLLVLAASLSFLVLPACAGPETEAAGILAFTRIQGKVYVLLADHVDSARGWGTFGGRREPGESVEDTAWREFHEETRCLYRDLPRAPNLPSVTVGTYVSYVLEVPYLPAQAFAAAPAREGCDAPEFRERGPWAWVPLEGLRSAVAGPTPSLLLPPSWVPPGTPARIFPPSAVVIQRALEKGLIGEGS